MIGRPFARLLSRMQFLHRAIGRWRSKPRPRYALALAGGGVIGGMYEVGALAALEERLNGSGRGFDVYVGCSAGSVVASLLAGRGPPPPIHQILHEDPDDPINLGRNPVFARDPLPPIGRAAGRGRAEISVGA